MDTSALLTQKADLESQIATTTAQLATVNTDLAAATFVNQIEALTADQVASTNVLLNEPPNTRGILLTIANPNG
jgi:hypothetical protein